MTQQIEQVKEIKNVKNTGKLRKIKTNYIAMLGCLGIMALAYTVVPELLESKNKEGKNLESVFLNDENLLLENLAMKLETTKINVETLKHDILLEIENYKNTHEFVSQEIKLLSNEIEVTFKIADIYNKTVEEVKAEILASLAQAMYTNDCKESLEENTKGL